MGKSVRGVTARSKRAAKAHPERSSTSADWSLYAGSGQRKYLTAEERQRFLVAADAMAPAVKTFCLTLMYCGCRLSEALALTAADVEIDSGMVAIRSLKKRGRLVVRQVPAPPILLKLLADVHGLRSVADEAADRRLWSWRRTKAWQLVKGVMAAARVHRLPASPKGLRHGFGVHAILSGVPLHLVQRWMGHANIKTTTIYTNVLGPEERQIAWRMWQ